MTAPRFVSDLLPPPATPAEDKPKAFVERTIAITVEAFIPRLGEVRSCTFDSTVPTIADRQRMTQLFNRLAGGVSFSNMTPEDQAFYTMLATVFVQCTKMPEWFQEALQENVSYLVQVYNECCEHATRYLRGIGGPGHSPSEVHSFRLSSTLPPIAEDVPG